MKSSQTRKSARLTTNMVWSSFYAGALKLHPELEDREACQRALDLVECQLVDLVACLAEHEPSTSAPAQDTEASISVTPRHCSLTFSAIAVAWVALMRW